MRSQSRKLGCRAGSDSSFDTVCLIFAVRTEGADHQLRNVGIVDCSGS
jgi:hypothetical protein